MIFLFIFNSYNFFSFSSVSLLRPARSEDESSKLNQHRARLTQMRRLWAGQGASVLLGDLMIMLGELTLCSSCTSGQYCTTVF